MIQVQQVDKWYGRVQALAGVDLETRAPERLVLLGPSGSGKTTLLRLIAGLEVPEAGSIRLDGVLVSGPGKILPPSRRRLGFVFQTPALWPHLTVAQHLLFGLAAWPREEASRRLAELLARTGLSALADRYPGQLSGGEARRVSLARSLAPRPRHLLLDEPLTNLDEALQQELLTLICQEAEQNRADLIYVTHNPEEARALATRIVRLHQGRVQDDFPLPGKAVRFEPGLTRTSDHDPGR